MKEILEKILPIKHAKELQILLENVPTEELKQLYEHRYDTYRWYTMQARWEEHDTGCSHSKHRDIADVPERHCLAIRDVLITRLGAEDAEVTWSRIEDKVRGKKQ